MKKFLLIFALLCAFMHINAFAGELTQDDIDRINEEKRTAALAEIDRVQAAAREKAENEMAAAKATAKAHQADVQRRIEAYEDWIDEQEELVYGKSLDEEDLVEEENNDIQSMAEEVQEANADVADTIAIVEVDADVQDDIDNENIIDVQSENAETAVKEAVAVANNEYGISNEDYDNLLKIVEAEGLNSGLKGKIMIANVILNRVKSPSFDNTITGVIKAPGQFSPARSGKMNRVAITDETVEAVNKALSGENYAGVALYFRSAKRGTIFLGRTAVASEGGNNFYN